MKVVGQQRIHEFCARHPEALGRMFAWLGEAGAAEWATPQAIRDRYASASFLADNRVVFDIGGNRFRLVVKVAYRTKIVSVERVGTHAEYDDWEL